MSADPLLGAALLGGFVAFVLVVIYVMPAPGSVRRLLMLGLVLRIFGGWSYFYLLGGPYGVGDHLLYLERGGALAEWVGEGAWDRVMDPREWWVGQWWGTQFVIFLTGGVLAVLGPSPLGAFAVFSMIGYVGIVALALAFWKAFPGAAARRYLAVIVLFPSLWFWPAALGKDAVVLCGVGLAALGLVGRGWGRWALLALGVGLVFAIRPQVAAVVAFSLIAGYWLAQGLRWRFVHVVQGLVLLAVGALTVSLSSGALGFRLLNPVEVEAYFDRTSEALAYGGSAVGTSGRGVSPWMAPVNALFRPFVWEARGATALLAALEMVLLWGLVWWRRREAGAFVRRYRRAPLFWVAVVFLILYTAALGMAVTNLGMMARQRVHLLPFLLMFVAGAPALRRRRAFGGGDGDSPRVGVPAPAWGDPGVPLPGR